MSEAGEFVGVTELARRHGVTRAAIHAAIQRGALPAVKIGNSFGIPVEAAADYVPAMDPSAKGKRSGEARQKKARKNQPLPWQEWQQDSRWAGWRNAEGWEIRRTFYPNAPHWDRCQVHYGWPFDRLTRFMQIQWLRCEQELHGLGLKPLEAVLAVRCCGPFGCQKRLEEWRKLLACNHPEFASVSELILLQATLDDTRWWLGPEKGLRGYLQSRAYMSRLWRM